MESQKLDVEKLLLEGNTVQLPPIGYSMYPVIVPGRDKVVIVPLGEKEGLKRGDVVLYRRDGSVLVLHRIWKVKADGFYMVGDNQREIEGPLRRDQIRGKMTVLLRKEREISTEDFRYRLFTGIWLWLRPFRPYISRVVAAIKYRIKAFKKNSKK